MKEKFEGARVQSIEIFKNNEFGEIRTLVIENKPYFVGKDIAERLGYKNTNKALNDHCKKAIMTWGNDSLGRKQEMKIIPEGDLYRLIIKSNLPKAQQFEAWVMEEVLPQIRQTGGYIPIDNEMSEAEIMAKALQISQKTIEKKDKLIKEKDRKIEEQESFLNQISASTNSVLVRDVAHLATKKDMKIGERTLYGKLREWGLIQKNNTKPVQRALEQGLFEVNGYVIQRNSGTETKYTTKVTGKGQRYIIDRLIKEDAQVRFN